MAQNDPLIRFLQEGRCETMLPSILVCSKDCTCPDQGGAIRTITACPVELGQRCWRRAEMDVQCGAIIWYQPMLYQEQRWTRTTPEGPNKAGEQSLTICLRCLSETAVRSPLHDRPCRALLPCINPPAQPKKEVLFTSSHLQW